MKTLFSKLSFSFFFRSISIVCIMIFLIYSGCSEQGSMPQDTWTIEPDPFEVTVVQGDSAVLSNITVRKNGALVKIIEVRMDNFLFLGGFTYTYDYNMGYQILELKFFASTFANVGDYFTLLKLAVKDENNEISFPLTIHVAPKPGLQIQFSPDTVTIEQGKIDTIGINIYRYDWSGTVENFLILSEPNEFDPVGSINPQTTTGNSVNYSFGTGSIQPGTYNVIVQAAGLTPGGPILAEDTLTVNVTAASLWVDVTPGTVDFLNDVYFPTGTVGYAVGRSGTILNSTDAGVTWSPQISGTSENLESVHFINAAFGFVVGENGVILKTTNGGINWNPLSSVTSANLFSVFIVDTQNIWVAGGGNNVFSTDDGGTTWKNSLIPISPNNGILGIWFTDSQNGVLVGSDANKILLTTDAGTTWSVIYVGARQLNDIYFFDDLEGVACGVNESMFNTTDGGMSWSSENAPLNNWNAIHFNGGLGIAVGESFSGNSGNIITTKSGGWNFEETGLTNINLSLWGVAVLPDGMHAVAVGFNGIGGIIIRRQPN